MSGNINRFYRCYDLPKNELPDSCNRTRDGGRKGSGKAAKRSSDRWARREFKKFIAAELAELALA